MGIIEIKELGTDKKADANIKNQSFSIFGKMIPALSFGKWDYEIEYFDEHKEICFPDFEYSPGDEEGFFLGAYDGECCIGLAVLRKELFNYLYLDDLKVNADYRRSGVGTKLIEAALSKARELGLLGVYAIAQDNNLAACLFYLKSGFQIGGFDNRAYRGTPQEEKADIYFYRDVS